MTESVASLRRTALFGGSFNPPHAAHQLVALYVLETCAIDELWFVPTFAHPFHKPLVDFEHRVAMCELAVAPLGPRVRVSRAEAELAAQPGFVSSRTVELVEMLRAREPARQFYLAIGADILQETAQWHRWDDLCALAPPIVIGRPHYASDRATGLTMPDISATRIRELIAAGDASVGSLVPHAVLRYIASHGLYK
ncbi:MAG TPA: nicotinate (nicotinamide) nucleotide adenylyltransferase [Kofleriaceae bacterium]|jgi:nicotinate-nucleotide adenylyltransferase|nr:nicotinate (nicotinamide) nucleotide adenylyltransferase [Kofleriaceae bacterium]